MEKYIGTKLIEAEPANRITGKDFPKHIQPADCPVSAGENVEPGYRVRYADGYESWSPKDVFEEAYRPVNGLTFGLAIEAAKKGHKIARHGWNGKNQYVQLATGISYTSPDGTVINVNHDAIGNAALAFCGTSGVQMGWLASQSDMLAEDWRIVD